MTDYIELKLKFLPINEDITDLAAAFLCDIGYESFQTGGDTMSAFIREDLFDAEAARESLSDFPIDCKIDISYQKVEGQDWNEEWEKHYFKPIVVGGECVVHSSFHKDVPTARYDILVDPKMAFGTGHHSTTSLMMRYILENPMEGKSVIDMGTGTGILAILAKMRGAGTVTGIEIDEAAWENSVENCRLNNIEADMIHGDASALATLMPADYLFANINRNIILNDINIYVKALRENGQMMLSGFYEQDIHLIVEAAEALGLELVEARTDNNWSALRLRLKSKKE